jgi:hypothetical protein
MSDFKCDGLRNTFHTEHTIMRILWITLFLTCSSYSLYCMIGTLQDYQKFETVVSIRYLRETPTDFPAVTFCNLNPLNELLSYDMMSILAEYQLTDNWKKNITCQDSKIKLMREMINTIYLHRLPGYFRDMEKYCNETLANSSVTVDQAPNGFELFWCFLPETYSPDGFTKGFTQNYFLKFLKNLKKRINIIIMRVNEKENFILIYKLPGRP